MCQFDNNERIVLNWATAHGFIAEPQNDKAKETCERLAARGYLEERFSDHEKRFPHYAITQSGKEAIRADLTIIATGV